MKQNEILEVEIAGAAYGGKGLVRVDGMAVFVRDAVPMDRIRIQISRRKKSFAEARVLERITPSPLRVSAPCPYSGVCGGCSWQCLAYSAQLEYKRQHVQESIAHIGLMPDVRVLPTIPSEQIFGYRNKVEFTCSPFKWQYPGEDRTRPMGEPAIGFHAPEVYFKVIDIEQCLLFPDAGNLIYRDIREYVQADSLPVYNQRTHEGFWRFIMLRHSLFRNQWMVNIVTSGPGRGHLQPLADLLHRRHESITCMVNNITAKKAGISFGESEHLLHGEPVIRDRIDDLEFDISANSFFQTNSRGAETLYGIVARYAALTGTETVLDLYSGTGTISLYLARTAAVVVGLELVEAAIRDAMKNAARHRITNCRFIAGDVRKTLSEIAIRPDVVIIDPPRNGMHPDVLKQVQDMAPERIVYVSCNPATLARDLLELKTAYHVVEVQPVDMFPHTFHIESVALLERFRDDECNRVAPSVFLP
jgi:23S rRNA (uracil1939-C5)-methyltransferase